MKIDLTYKMKRAGKKTPALTSTQVEALSKLHSHPLFKTMQNLDTLKKEVIKALKEYTGSTIYDADAIFNLAEYLTENPVCELTDTEFALVENALVNATVEVKVTWKAMLNELNQEE